MHKDQQRYDQKRNQLAKEVQAKRIKDREKDPLKNWKLSSLDYQSHEKYDYYIELRDKMFLNSGTYYAPWIMLDANDKKRARLNLARFLLDNINYEGKNSEHVCGVDKKVVTLFS